MPCATSPASTATTPCAPPPMSAASSPLPEAETGMYAPLITARHPRRECEIKNLSFPPLPAAWTGMYDPLLASRHPRPPLHVIPAIFWRLAPRGGGSQKNGWAEINSSAVFTCPPTGYLAPSTLAPSMCCLCVL